MTTAAEILRRCADAGLIVRLAGEDKLRLRRDAGPPDPALLEELRAAKPAIIAHLQQRARPVSVPCRCGRVPRYIPDSPPCYWCRRVTS